MALGVLVGLPDLVLQAGVYVVEAGEAYGRSQARQLAADVVFSRAQGAERPFRRKINPSSMQGPGDAPVQPRDKIEQMQPCRRCINSGATQTSV